MSSVQNIKVEPMNVLWGEDLAQVQLITATPSTSLANKYFMFYDVNGTSRYGWFNIAAAGTDPAIAGATAMPIALASTSLSASAVASAIASAIDALTGYVSTADGAVVTMTHVAVGRAKPAHEGGAATAFQFEVVKYGDSQLDLGYVDGSIEASFEVQNVDVTAHQTGSEVLSHINTGNNVSVTLNIKETTVAQLRKAFLDLGDSALPAGNGIGAAEVFGYGQSRLFKQSIDRSKKLILHPKVLGTYDKSRDLCFWKACAMPESLSFSGEEILTCPVSFMVYLDESKPSPIQKFCYGDHSQF
jgi:hypothetical protein